MKGRRLATSVAVCLLTGASLVLPAPVFASADASVPPGDAAPLLRLFLHDGTSLVSYGEVARVEDRVVFSMPTSLSDEDPHLQLVDIAADRVDWSRTVDYAEAVRASRYLATRAELDYAELTAAVASALNDVATTKEPARRLAIVERARRVLADWPPRHYGYKQDDVQQMLSLLDEAIAELQVATGSQRFDLRLVASVEPRRFTETLLPEPTQQELIEQALRAADLSGSPAARTTLLSVAVASIDRHKAYLAPEWAASARASAVKSIAREVEVDRAYHTLGERAASLAPVRAKAADVRGLENLLAQVRARDRELGNARPDTLSSILALVEEQLDAARRLQLARERYTMRLAELRHYQRAMRDSLQSLRRVGPALEDIKALAGSSADAIATILTGTAVVLQAASSIQPPDELSEVHALFVSAAQLAESAARTRREAALTSDMTRAWNASSAAAGALMLSARVVSEMQRVFRLPQLQR